MCSDVRQQHNETQSATAADCVACLYVCPVQLVRELNVPDNWEKEHEDEDHVAWLTHETVQVRLVVGRHNMADVDGATPLLLVTFGPPGIFLGF